MSKDAAKLALRFVLIIGVVNLFADLTYEGARSITGPFLGSQHASAVVVGVVAGFGELLGYSLRSVSGYLADKTHRYWLVTFVGYAVNMLCVPALALAGNWPVAAALIIGERTGRAIRRPAVETMISYTSKTMGSGWVFGLNEAMDQGGATVGPLVVSLVLYLKGGFKLGFAVLLIPALLCLSTLVVARCFYPRPTNWRRSPPTFLRRRASQTILAVRGRGRSDRRRLCGLRLDCIPLPAVGQRPCAHHPHRLRGSDGLRGGNRAGFWPSFR